LGQLGLPVRGEEHQPPALLPARVAVALDHEVLEVVEKRGRGVVGEGDLQVREVDLTLNDVSAVTDVVCLHALLDGEAVDAVDPAAVEPVDLQAEIRWDESALVALPWID